MKTDMMTAATERFVLHWGELGPRWGVNRTVAQIHALLYLSERPLNAEDIATTLGVARSNVSTSLKELESWKLVRTVPTLGDRREHYETLKDVWEMFKTILDGRKQREIDPTLEILRECAAAAKGDKHAEERLNAMKDLFESASAWYTDIRPIPAGIMKKLLRMGGKVTRIIGSLVLGVWLVGTAQAQAPELLKARSEGSFFEAVKTLKPGDEWKKFLKKGLELYFKEHTVRVARSGICRPAPAGKKPAVTVALKPLRNRQWTSATLFKIGGFKTAVSGQFARSNKAYFGIYPEGAAAPIFVSLDDMIDEKGYVNIKGAEYQVSLSPNLMDRLGSKVVFTSLADKTKSFGVTMQRILGIVYDDGVAFDWNNVAIRHFWGQDVDDSVRPVAAGNAESLAFMMRAGGDYYTYLIPVEQVPTDGSIGDFRLRPGLSFALRILNGELQVFQP